MPHRKPHATGQQRVYVPSGTPLAVEVDEGMLEREIMSRPGSPRHPRSPSEPSSSKATLPPDADADANDAGYESDADGEGARPPHERTASADSWVNLRSGSFARRRAWRRPSTRWVLPFITAITFSLGVTTAPRAELIVDMACLVNPPRTPSNAVSGVSAWETTPADLASVQPYPGQGAVSFAGLADFGLAGLGGVAGLEAPPRRPVPAEPVIPREPLTPAARWFIDAQRAIRARLPSPGSPGGPTPDNSTSPYPEIDPKLCQKDPGVASAAAQLTKVITMSAGLLAALTTGFWASVSDRVGRRKIMAVVALGLMVNDACFLFFASSPWLLVRSRMYVLLIGPIFDGALGGLSTVTATIHAYVSDVTPDGSRAAVFAQVGGALMLGLLFGPITSSALVYATDNM